MATQSLDPLSDRRPVVVPVKEQRLPACIIGSVTAEAMMRASSPSFLHWCGGNGRRDFESPADSGSNNVYN